MHAQLSPVHIVNDNGFPYSRWLLGRAIAAGEHKHPCVIDRTLATALRIRQFIPAPLNLDAGSALLLLLQGWPPPLLCLVYQAEPTFVIPL